MNVSVKIDFDADADFDGSEEDVSALLDDNAGVVWSRGKSQIRRFAAGEAGQSAFVLHNISRDYSPENPDSPIAGQVLPGRKVRIEAGAIPGGGFDFMDGTGFDFMDGTSFDFMGVPGRQIWNGLTDNIDQRPEREALSVGFGCLGNFSKLVGKKVSTALYENISTSEALDILLDVAGWPADERSIQPGLTIMRYWWLDQADAFQEAEILKTTEGAGASWYENAQGFPTFENRDSRTTQTRSTVSQATFSGSLIKADGVAAMRYNPNFKDTIEAAVIKINEREMQGQTVIWQRGETLTLGSNETRRIEIRANGEPFKNAIVPSPIPNNTIQTLTADAVLTSGTFKLKFLGEITSSLDWDSTAADWGTALEALTTIGAGNIICAGGPINSVPIICMFVGVFAGLSIADLIQVIDPILNPISAPATITAFSIQDGTGVLSERQGLQASAPLTGGSYLIDFGGSLTPSISYDAVAATLQTAVRTVYGAALVTGGELDNGVAFTMNLIVSTDEPLAEIVELVPLTSNVGTATINAVITTAGGVPDFVRTAGSITFSFDRTSGASCTLIAQAGAAGATVTGLQVRANIVSVARSFQASYPESGDAPTGKVYQPNIRPDISLEAARQHVRSFVEYYSVARPTIPFQVVTELDDPANDSLYEREISDLITIIEAQTGVNGNYYIEQIHQAIVGLSLVTTFGCEQAPGAVLGSSVVWY